MSELELYRDAVSSIKNAVLQSRYRAASSANAEQLSLYYGVGGYISANTRSGKWGSGAIETISQQLQSELPGLRGFSPTNMKSMRLFYEEWAGDTRANRQLSTADLQEKGCEETIRQLPTAESSEGITDGIIRHLASDELNNEDMDAFLRVGFTHHREIIAKCKNLDERWYYINRCAAEFWSVERLKSHIRAQDYQHTGGL